jgi:hypothetical protein
MGVIHTMTPPDKARYPVSAHVRMREETAKVIKEYAKMLKVRPSDAHRALLDIACGQVAGLLNMRFSPEQPPPPSLSTVRRRKAAGIPVPGSVVANARRTAKAQAISRRRAASPRRGAA